MFGCIGPIGKTTGIYMAQGKKPPPSLAEKVQQKNRELIEIIHRTKVNTSYAYEETTLLDEKVRYLADNFSSVLDFGKSSRDRFKFFTDEQITTADINQYHDYPDIFIDICDASTFPQKKYDAIICNAVLEHVYDPASAVENLYNTLNEGGICLAQAPFCFRYHAPDDHEYQDYFRFTRDGLAFLFRNFSDVTLYTGRGRTSAGLNWIFPSWKAGLEKMWPGVSKWSDKIVRGHRSSTQVSGYFVWAIK